MLSYYSMQLSSIFIPEGFMALFMSNQRARGELTSDMNSLYTMMATFADLLKNEHLFDHGITRERTMERAKFFLDRGIVSLDDNMKIWLVETESNIQIMNFFKALVLPLVDTYLIVLLAIERLCGKNTVLKQKKLVKELHIAFKTLYTDKHIPFLHSCLKEIISTAIERFEEAGYLVIR